MLIFPSTVQRLLLCLFSVLMLVGIASAQYTLPDPLASPLVSEEQKRQLKELQGQKGKFADADEFVRWKAEQLSQQISNLTIAEVNDALLQQAQVDTQQWQLRHEELAHRLAAAKQRMEALKRLIDGLTARVELLRNPALRQEEGAWYVEQFNDERYTLVQRRFDFTLEQERHDLFTVRLKLVSQAQEMAERWKNHIETLMQQRFQERSDTIQSNIENHLSSEHIDTLNRFLSLSQQLKENAANLSDAQRRHLETKNSLVLDGSYVIAQKLLVQNATEVLTDSDTLITTAGAGAGILSKHYRRTQQIRTELATLEDEIGRRVALYEKQRGLIQQRLNNTDQANEIISAEATLVNNLLVDLRQIQATVQQQQGRAETVGKKLLARYEKVRTEELFTRQPFLQGTKSQTDLVTQLMKAPQFLYFQVQVSLTSIINAIARLDPSDWSVIIALQISLLAALITFWHISGYFQRKLQSSAVTSTFAGLGYLLVRLLRMNLLWVGLFLALVAFSWVLKIGPPSEEIVLTLLGIGIATKLTSDLAWLYLVHPDLPEGRRFPGFYRLFAVTLWLGSLLVAGMTLGHFSGLETIVLNTLDRLFMAYLLLITLPVLHLRRLLIQRLLNYYGRRPWVNILRLTSMPIPISLLGIGLAGVLGYHNLAWTGANYLLVFSGVLAGWLLSQQLLNDLGSWLKQRAFHRSREEWVTVRRVVEALQRAVSLFILLLAIFSLIEFYSLTQAIVDAWTVLMSAVIIVVALYELLFLLAEQSADKSEGKLIGKFISQARKPLGVILPVAAAQVTLPRLELPEDVIALGNHGLILLQIAAITWLFLRLIALLDQVSEYRYRRADVAEDLSVRRARTQLRVLRQALHLTTILIGVGAMLMTFPGVRQFGTGLLASAGAAGLVIGIAARPLFENLIAGIQIALTQPIRLDDVVIVEGEWGTIEEINATYVVVRIWDDRRLVVPLKYFNENPFQHWSRKDTHLLGSVFLSVDYSFPVDEGRKALKRILDETDLWDKRAWVLQVTDLKGHSMELRALATARDAPTAWDLRCYVREKLIEFIQQNYPESLPQLRTRSALETEEQRRLEVPFIVQPSGQSLA